jgi:hypothetical protein
MREKWVKKPNEEGRYRLFDPTTARKVDEKKTTHYENNNF